MYTQKQIKKLLQNKNVLKCSESSITYCRKFKLKAVKQYFDEGYSPKMIFDEAGFDANIITKDKAKDCLKRWKKIYKNKGENNLLNENRGNNGGRDKKSFKNDKEKIEYLETKIAYLDAENDFLAKLRGLKRK
jgi:hypothetical protein